jgi:hypothetical protein
VKERRENFIENCIRTTRRARVSIFIAAVALLLFVSMAASQRRFNATQQDERALERYSTSVLPSLPGFLGLDTRREQNGKQPKSTILSHADPSKSGKGNLFSIEPNQKFWNSIIYNNQVLKVHDQEQRLNVEPRSTVAYAITVPECGSEPLWDGVAVLGENNSIEQ